MVRLGRRLLPFLRRNFEAGLQSWIRWQSALRRALAEFAPIAQRRGLLLLKQNLSPEQLNQYENFGHFEVLGGQTGRRYLIKNGFQMNIDIVDAKGGRLARLCFAPEGELPTGDVLLAQKLALELFEEDALKIANCCPGRHYTWSPGEHLS
jgi:hypothetical protein